MEDCANSMNIAILGCGFMGTAILKGLIKKFHHEDFPAIKFAACVGSEDSWKRVKEAISSDDNRVHPCIGYDHYALAARDAEVVFLGVPPSSLIALLKLESTGENGSIITLMEELCGKITISLLAGTSCDQILGAFPIQLSEDMRSQFHITRAIPSIAAQDLDSITLLADTHHAGQQHMEMARWLFEQIGTVHFLPEHLMDEATAAHATCNALTMVAVEAVTDAAVAEGLTRNVTLSLVANSLRSAARMLSEGMTPESMKGAMSIPNGITINALLELERKQVRSGISNATMHAIAHTRRMT